MRSLFARISFPHHLLLALFFFAGLEVVAIVHHWVFWLLVSLCVTVIIGISLYRIEEGSFHASQLILPSLAVIALSGFALFLPFQLWLHGYFVFSAAVLFVLLRRAARLAYPTWNLVASLLVFFLLASSILGWRFYFYAPVLAILVLIFFTTAALSWQWLLRFGTVRGEALLLAVVVAFIACQLAWAVLFLPLHYITQAAILTLTYYFMAQLLAVSYERAVHTRDVVEYATVGLLAGVILSLAI
jgi:hypothetical protein